MKAEPLKKSIYDKAMQLGIQTIDLRFSGGHDEGILEIEVYPYEHQEQIEEEIKNWAWKAYEYSGAGEGYDFGDNISYDLEQGQVYATEWKMVVEENDEEPIDLEFVE